MKKLTVFLLSSVLLFGAAACSEQAKTTADAPAANEGTVQAPEAEDTEQAKADAESELRRQQLNADIKAREERNNALNQGQAEGRPDEDLASQVRSKLEANIPNGQLTVEVEDDAVTVAGTVPNQDQLNKIESLAKEIKGVKTVTVNATVAKPQ
ncbi:BON domain-containing protein [Microcoleus sp. FACHB-SPT15]|uniref:BON domain-containing protein n=1 Tax=Microcoleus sp. FACHB-SPT15 TaxID=2692830 RepID=UPI00177F4DEB|nr:BON domain-containing protein [Microcoleus sp. FACHB-SPT15]MBD1808696.1 BON domain-containing protein [Microcoleus sp. FACHB-SPT15]